MANEIITRSAKRGNVTVPTFEEDEKNSIAFEPRKLKISCRKSKNKTTGNVFNKVTGYVILDCYDMDGNFKETKVKGLSVHFKKKAFSQAINVKDIEDLKSGYLYVVAKGLQIPSRYQIKEETDKDGKVIYNKDGEAKLKYPEIWIDNDSIIGNEQFVSSQDALNVDNYENPIDVKCDENGGIIDEDIEQYNEDEDIEQYNEDEEKEI